MREWRTKIKENHGNNVSKLFQRNTFLAHQRNSGLCSSGYGVLFIYICMYIYVYILKKGVLQVKMTRIVEE